MIIVSFELVIIGGGPAGATAAKIAAEGGIKVLLLEAAEEGRYKCCAGGIPVSNEEFTPIPHNVKEREITGGVLVTPSSGVMQFEAIGEKNRGYCMFRTDFDKFLIDLARDAGAQVEYNYFAKHIEIRNSKNIIVKGIPDFETKCVILATGLGGARLQRGVGIEVPPMINGIQAEFEIPENQLNESFGNKIWEFFDHNIVDHGVGWAFPKLNAVSIGVLGPNAKLSHFNSFLKYKYLKDKITNSEMLNFGGRKIWAAPIPDRIINKPYREKIMVVGDACGVADPVLYEGIYQARLSGKIAAQVFLQAYEAEDFSDNFLSRYHKQLLNLLYDDNLKFAYKIHELLYHSGYLEEIIDAVYALTKNDTEMRQAVTALFSGSQTRREIWKVMMSRKWRLMRKMGVRTGLKLLPTLLKAIRI
ncbi:MAG: FAD-binding protein [Candidatus Lokiarchaeota archaeon]|nr:FAD-binding protein [Candidatus Lokiarchaeota archaeon]